MRIKIIENKLFKDIVTLFLSYKWYLFGLLLFSIVFICLNIIKPYILSLLFDVGIAHKSLPDVLKFTFYFFLIMILTVFLSISHEYVVSTLANKFIFRIRVLLLNRMIDLPTSFFDRNSTGDIVTRVDDDVQDIRDYLLFDVTSFYQTILNFIGATIFIGMMQWRILVANLIILPVLVVVLHYFRKVLYKVSMEVKISLSASNKELVEGFKNINELKATNFELHFLQRLSERFNDLLKKSVRSSIVQESSSSCIQLVINFTYLITVGYGGYLIIQDLMTAGMLLAFLTMRSQLIAPVRSWSNLYSRYFIIKASLDRLSEYYGQEIEKGLEIQRNGEMLRFDSDVLKFKDVTFSYETDNGKTILNNLNAEFPTGSWIGIKGASGIGKTTLLKLILKLIHPAKGEIVYGGKRISEIHNRQWRQFISYVSQKPFALNESVRENLLMGRNHVSDAHLWKLLKICELDKDIEVLPQKLEDSISENGALFSGGMIKRLMLCRAILEPKPVLLLDEFFSALDTKLSRKLSRNLKSFLPANTTVLVISHRESDFEICDHVYELNEILTESHENGPDRVVHLESIAEDA